MTYRIVRAGCVAGLVAIAGCTPTMPGGTSDAAADATPLFTAAGTDYPTAPKPTFVALADVNGDGKIDIVVTSDGADTSAGADVVSVLLNQGSGKFAAKVDYPTGSLPGWVSIGDIDGDGKPDLVVASGGSATVSVLLNTGATGNAGEFGGKTDYPTAATGLIRTARAVAIGDFDGDGKPDLAVAGEGTNGNVASILVNRGAAGFAAPADYPTGKDPACVITGDVDGDGKTDVVVGNYTSDTVSVLLNAGKGIFAAAVNYPVGFPLSIALADLNGDGKPDFAIADWLETGEVMLNQGGGKFGAKIDYPLGDFSTPASVAVGDFDGDGKPDIALANYDGKTLSLLFNQGAGAFGSVVSYQAKSPYSLAAADLDGDGKPDLAVVNRLDDTVSVLLNTGDFHQQ